MLEPFSQRRVGAVRRARLASSSSVSSLFADTPTGGGWWSARRISENGSHLEDTSRRRRKNSTESSQPRAAECIVTSRARYRPAAFERAGSSAPAREAASGEIAKAPAYGRTR